MVGVLVRVWSGIGSVLLELVLECIQDMGSQQEWGWRRHGSVKKLLDGVLFWGMWLLYSWIV